MSKNYMNNIVCTKSYNSTSHHQQTQKSLVNCHLRLKIYLHSTWLDRHIVSFGWRIADCHLIFRSFIFIRCEYTYASLYLFGLFYWCRALLCLIVFVYVNGDNTHYTHIFRIHYGRQFLFNHSCMVYHSKRIQPATMGIQGAHKNVVVFCCCFA